MNIAKTQEQVLKADKNVVIIAEGRSKGATTALYFKAIASEGHSLFCGSYLKPSHMSGGFREVLKSLGIEYTMKRGFVGEHISWRDGLCSVLFVTPSKLLTTLQLRSTVSRVLVDNVDLLHKSEPSTLEYLLNTMKLYEQIVFTTNPFHCGWRNPNYANGVVERDNLGNVVYTGKSWDYPLVDWKGVEKRSEPYSVTAKAFINDYHSYVQVINNPKQVNPYCNVYKGLQGKSLSWYESMMLEESWIYGD